MSSTINSILLALCFISLVFGHSQMRCAKYNAATGECAAPIRNQGQAFDQEAYTMPAGGPICQSAMSNPITLSYSNGVDCGYAPCPLPMGTFRQGEDFTVMWFARTHSIDNQTPGRVKVYLSPVESMNQGTDTPASRYQKICEGPYSNCGGQNGDQTKCTLQCTMPQDAGAGIHTIWWLWDWDNHNTNYSTCADIVVEGSNTGSASSSSSTTGRVQSSTSSSTTGRAQSSTSSSSTTGRVQSSTSTSTSTTGTHTPTPTSTSGSSSSCVVGQQRCSSSETYQICMPSGSSTYWSYEYSCRPDHTCHQTDFYAYCY